MAKNRALWPVGPGTSAGGACAGFERSLKDHRARETLSRQSFLASNHQYLRLADYASWANFDEFRSVFMIVALAFTAKGFRSQRDEAYCLYGNWCETITRSADRERAHEFPRALARDSHGGARTAVDRHGHSAGACRPSTPRQGMVDDAIALRSGGASALRSLPSADRAHQDFNWRPHTAGPPATPVGGPKSAAR